MYAVVLDFETASGADLKRCGAWRYAECPTTEILCLGYMHETANAATVLTPEDLLQPPPAWVTDPDCMVVAHNAGFEKAIWRNIMVPLYAWPDIPNERWHDTQAVCAMKSLPLKLERAATALRLHHQKDTEGTRETLAAGRTNRKGYLDRSPERLARIYEYNASDCVAELELHRRVRGLGASERHVWLLDQKINERGVRLDMGFVDAAQKICDAAAVPLAKEFARLTGELKPTQRDKFMGWLEAQGAGIDNLRKETIAKLLGDDDAEEDDSLAGEDAEDTEISVRLPDQCRRALQIRSILGSASIKKLGAMRACVGSDGRARGLLQYHGAGPGRWAGRLLQPQNFPRPTLKIDGKGHDPEELVEAILTGDAEYVRVLFGEPINAVASGLRHALVAAPGSLFEVGDFATIEARIVLAIAGQHDKLALITGGQDIYIDMAQRIHQRPIDKKKDPEERQDGKATVLGSGFGLGWRGFKKKYAENRPDEFAQKCIRAYREDFAPRVPKLWYALEEAATKCVWDRRPTEAYGLRFEIEDAWLTLRLYSGRKLWYYGPRKITKAMPWDPDDIRPGVGYMAWKLGQWRPVDAWYGQWMQNIAEGVARDLLVHGMFKYEAMGHPAVLSVHDEGIFETPEHLADARLLDTVLCDRPYWAIELGLPVNAETWVGARYRK